MPRVLVVNNYPLTDLMARVASGKEPDQFLFGVNYFSAAGWDVDILDPSETRFLSSVDRLLRKMRFPIPLGSIEHQHRALRRIDQADVVYCPCQTQIQSLAYLRSIGIIRRPLVCLAHHPLNVGRLRLLRDQFLRVQINGTDAFPSLSKKVAAQINSIFPGKSEVLQWGPDAAFYPSDAEPGEGAIAIGRTGRDFCIFGAAATESRTRAKIVCLQDQVQPSFQKFGGNVKVDGRAPNAWMSFLDVVREYRAYRVLAIPLADQTNLAGLSSLMDALAMGKPVIMTRLPTLDLDVEKEGIGRWVSPGDTAGWVRALKWFDENADAAFEMGRRARNLVDRGMNSRSFAHAMLQILETVVARRMAPC